MTRQLSRAFVLRASLGAIAFALAVGLGTAVAANTPVKQVTFSGLGSASDAGASCADIQCNGSDTCDCHTGTASGSAVGLGNAQFAWELSIDTSVTENTGNGGSCMPAIGNATLTAGKSSINVFMVGWSCADPLVAQHGLFNGTFRLNGSGTGKLTNSRGLGSIEIGSIGHDTTEVVLSGGTAVIP